MKQITVEEVKKHNTQDDCWIIVHGKVYDVTKFLSEHPGGKKILLQAGGTDASAKFVQFHNNDLLKKYTHLLIGEVSATTAPAAAPAPAPAAPTAVAEKKKKKPSEAAIPKEFINMLKKSGKLFGTLTPYVDPAWYQGFESPYYNESHRRLRKVVREFVDKEIMPFCHEWDEKKAIPAELRRKCFEAGFLPASIGHWPTEYVGDKIAGGVKPEEFDAFHELIIADELSRCGSGGVCWGLSGGLSIGLPPVMKNASPELKKKVVGPCLKGEKVICLCITEPYGGSDVANLKTSAVKSPCGKYYIVNGEKKWITNGAFADFFTVAVRTGGEGLGGVSLLLLERGMQGLSTKPMNCTGVWPSGTSYITFEDVKVPVENLIGKENQGFKYVMYNFNHERWGVVVQSTRFARVLYEEAFKYANKRETFGQKLIENPLIRNKLANMLKQIESTWAQLEYITYQMVKMPKAQQNLMLAGPLSILKAHSTQVFEYCAREAVQVFGGLGYSRGGQGEKVERLYREVKAFALGGGSEEILFDLGMRMAVKFNSKL